jgi:hypothetical protein
MSDPWTLGLLITAALGIPAAMLAWVLRLSQVPGGRAAAAITAGITVGLLAGPGVLAHIRPDLHATLFLGAATERAAHDELASRQDADALALLRAGVTPAAVEELRARQAEELRPLAEVRDRAARAHRDALWWAAQVVLALYLLLIGPSLVPVGPRAVERVARGLFFTRGNCFIAGIMALAFAAALPVALARWPMGVGTPAALAFGLVLAIPGLAASLRPPAYVAAAIACITAAGIALIIGWSPGMTVAGAGLFLGLMAGVGLPESPRTTRARRAARSLALAAALPALTAIAAVTVNLQQLADQAPRAFWTALVVAVVCSSDGRWTAAWLAWKLLRRGPHHPVRFATALTNAGAGPATLALLIVLTAADIATPPMLAAGLLAAAIVELTRGAREWLTHMLETTDR